MAVCGVALALGESSLGLVGAGVEGEGALLPSSSPFLALCAVVAVCCDPRGLRACV